MKKLIISVITIILFLFISSCDKKESEPIIFGTEYKTEAIVANDINKSTFSANELETAEYQIFNANNMDFNQYTGDMPDYYGKILDVADGDTFYVHWYTEKRMGIRVKGVDTPEVKDRRKKVQYWGPEASKFAKKYLKKGSIVRLDFQGNITGPFGRLLAYVYIWDNDKQEWIFWNKKVLEEGMAYVYWKYSFESPIKFLQYQANAIKAKKGMWAHPELIDNDVVTNIKEFYDKASWFRSWLKKNRLDLYKRMK